jgi:hypothetical protein
MKSISKIVIPMLSLFIILFLANCKDDEENPTPVPDSGKIKLAIAHHYDGKEVVYNKMQYVNAAGNDIEVYEVQWFISDIIFYPHQGNPIKTEKGEDIFYIDNAIPSSMNFYLEDVIPPATYDSIAFTFGINEQKNISYMFVNPPEANMDWPSIYGGGYHYMKLDGFWNDSDYGRRAFNFHLGIGRVISPTDTHYVQNYYSITFKNTPFTIEKDKTKEIQIIMNIEEWFKNPNIYDFDYWGPMTMESQDAMAKITENGLEGVFELGYIKDID